MKTQLKTKTTSKTALTSGKTLPNKANALKWVIADFGFVLLALWITWFICDCIFVSNGIKVEQDTIIFGQKGIVGWHWDSMLYNMQQILCYCLLGLTGAYMGLLFSYMIICGLNIKSNLKHNLYQIITTGAALITMTICVIMAGKMMIDQKYVLGITVSYDWSSSLLPTITEAKFDVFHLNFLKWVSIIPAAVIFSSVIILGSLRQLKPEILIKDTNILIIIFAFALIGLFAAFVVMFGFNDPAAEGLEIIEGSITWRHITAQCITTPIGVFAGMIMVLTVLRIVYVIFIYNNRWHEKKAHLIIFAIITFLVFAGFIISHVNPLDFEKLVLDYQSMKLGGLLVILAETVFSFFAGIYCLISHINYQKNRAL